MSFKVDLKNPMLIKRFEPYFKHPDPNRHVLDRDDRAVACKNAKTVLALLGFARAFGDDPQLYDRELSEAVKLFQKKTRHRNIDGVIGPGTRSQLVSKLIEQFGASKFNELDPSDRIPIVFLSYAWADTPQVDKLDQWLSDHRIHVIRDVRFFKAGSNIEDNIWESVLLVDKVIAVYSRQSKTRDWPTFERQIAEKVEELIRTKVLVYLCLDSTRLNAYDPHRIAIKTRGKTLQQIGLEIQKSLHGPEPEPAQFAYDENAPL